MWDHSKFWKLVLRGLGRKKHLLLQQNLFNYEKCHEIEHWKFVGMNYQMDFLYWKWDIERIEGGEILKIIYIFNSFLGEKTYFTNEQLLNFGGSRIPWNAKTPRDSHSENLW